MAVLRSNRILAKPKGKRPLEVIRYLDASAALTSTYQTEACTAGYYSPRIPHRLAPTLLSEYGCVSMTWLVLDVDDETAHTERKESSADWWRAERQKIDRLIADHPDPFVYRTRGGYRVIYKLAVAFLVKTESDAASWSASYSHILDRLRDAYGIEGDRACIDWAHLYILPHATRSGGKPENRATLGDPSRIGRWSLDIVEPAPVPARREAMGTAAESAIGRACIEQGLLIEERDSGAMLIVKCPFRSEHSAGPDGSGTVVYAATGERRMGWLHCKHAHCSHRAQGEFRRALGIEEEPSGVRRLRSMLDVEPTGALIGLHQVEETLADAMRLASPSRLVVMELPLGVGKTRALVNAAAASDKRFVIASPRHDLADEIARALIDRGEKVDRRRGLLRVVGADDVPLCREHERAAEWQRAGGSITSLCRTCQHRIGCPARVRGAAQRIVSTPHQLAAVAMAHDEEESELIEEDDEPEERPVLVFDEAPALLTELSITSRELQEAEEIIVRGETLDSKFAMNVAAWTHALRMTVDDAEMTLPDACSFVDRQAMGAQRREAPSLLAWATQPKPNANAVRRGEFKLGHKPELATDSLLSLSRDRWREATRAVKIFAPILAAARDVRRVAFRSEGLAVHVISREAALLLDGGAIVLDATPPMELLQALAHEADIDLVRVTRRVSDSTKHTRTILYSSGASRTKLAPRRVVNWDAARPLVRRALDAVPDDGGRILLCTYKSIADGLRAGKLADVVKPYAARLDIAHYGNVRGSNAWTTNVSCVTLGDPFPEVIATTEQAKVSGIDPDDYVLDVTRSELAQTHGRLRDTSRNTPAHHVHVGAVAPRDWTNANTTIEVNPTGRPRHISNVSTEDLRGWVAAQKSKREAAKVLGLPLTTLLRCLGGQALPRNAKIPTGLSGSLSRAPSEPESPVRDLLRGFRFTSAARRSRTKRKPPETASTSDDEGGPVMSSITFGTIESATSTMHVSSECSIESVIMGATVRRSVFRHLARTSARDHTEAHDQIRTPAHAAHTSAQYHQCASRDLRTTCSNHGTSGPGALVVEHAEHPISEVTGLGHSSDHLGARPTSDTPTELLGRRPQSLSARGTSILSTETAQASLRPSSWHDEPSSCSTTSLNSALIERRGSLTRDLDADPSENSGLVASWLETTDSETAFLSISATLQRCPQAWVAVAGLPSELHLASTPGRSSLTGHGAATDPVASWSDEHSLTLSAASPRAVVVVAVADPHDDERARLDDDERTPRASYSPMTYRGQDPGDVAHRAPVKRPSTDHTIHTFACTLHAWKGAA